MAGASSVEVVGQPQRSPTSIELSDKLTLLPVARWARRNGVGSVLLSHERLGDMLALRTGFDATSKVSIGLLNRLLVRSVDTRQSSIDDAEAFAKRVPQSSLFRTAISRA